MVSSIIVVSSLQDSKSVEWTALLSSEIELFTKLSWSSEKLHFLNKVSGLVEMMSFYMQSSNEVQSIVYLNSRYCQQHVRNQNSQDKSKILVRNDQVFVPLFQALQHLGMILPHPPKDDKS